MRMLLFFFTGCINWDKSESIVIEEPCPTDDCTDTSEPEIVPDTGNTNEPAAEPGNPPDTADSADSGDANEIDTGDAIDDDGDGFTEEQGDCDDNNPDIHPDIRDESVDGVDQDCNGVDGEDRDEDGVASVESGGTDCADDDDQINPGMEEMCDFRDNNCDEQINEDLECLVYAHTNSDLYKVDPFLGTITQVTSVPGLFDFDTDLNGDLYGFSSSQFYQYDATNQIWNNLGSLGISSGTPNGFAISTSGQGFATSGNGVYTVDIATGTTTFLGNMGGNFSSSGDCVMDKTDGLYMTSSTGSPGDDLVQIDPMTGTGTLVGNVGISGIWGLTSAYGFLFGFTSQGALILIDKDNGPGIIIHTFPGKSFYGAASSAMR